MFLVSGMWFASCKTSRNIEMQKQVDYSSEFQYLRNVIESLRLDVNKQTKITSKKLSDLKIENKTVDFSPPDSLGKQYPIRESTTTASKKEQENMKIDETMLLTMQLFSNRLDTISNKVDAMLDQKEKLVELSWWNLHKLDVYAAAFGLIIIGFKIYKVGKSSIFAQYLYGYGKKKCSK